MPCIGTVLAVGCATAVTPGTREAISPRGPASASETAVTFVSTAPGVSPAVVAAWNDQFQNFAIAYFQYPGAWFNCNRMTCNGGQPLTVADFQDTVPSTSIPAYSADPAIAGDDSDVGSGVVVAAYLSSSTVRGACTSACPLSRCTTSGVLPAGATLGCPHPGDAIVAVASFDGGVTWGSSRTEVRIVNQGTGPCDISQPRAFGPSSWPGSDRPHLAFGGQVDGQPHFWAEWNIDSNICIREMVADPSTRTLDSSGPSIAVASTDGDAIIRASGADVYVMFANAFTVPPCGSPGTMSWTLAVSHDSGGTWASHSVATSNTFDPCFGASQLGQSGNANAIFGFDVTPDGTLWAAILESQLTPQGNRRPTTPPGTPPITVLSSVDDGATWSRTPVLAAGQVGQVTLTAGARGDVAVSYYEAIPPTAVQIQRMVTVRSATSGGWSAPVAISRAFDPSTAIGGGGAGRIGEYQNGTSIDPSQLISLPSTDRFYEVWTEVEPSATAQYRVEGAAIGVTP